MPRQGPLKPAGSVSPSRPPARGCSQATSCCREDLGLHGAGSSSATIPANTWRRLDDLACDLPEEEAAFLEVNFFLINEEQVAFCSLSA